MGKHDGSERVLCVPGGLTDEMIGGRRGFIPRGEFPLASILDWSRFLPRTDALEEDSAWRQVIPYAILAAAGSWFVYRRPPSGGESRLHGRLSLGLGGHVNTDDAASDLCFPGQFPATIRACLARELSQEVGLRALPGHRFCGALVRDGAAVDRVHLGLVYRVDAGPQDLHPGPEVDPVGWFTPEALRAGRGPAGEWESWSLALLDQLGTN